MALIWRPWVYVCLLEVRNPYFTVEHRHVTVRMMVVAHHEALNHDNIASEWLDEGRYWKKATGPEAIAVILSGFVALQ